MSGRSASSTTDNAGSAVFDDDTASTEGTEGKHGNRVMLRERGRRGGVRDCLKGADISTWQDQAFKNEARLHSSNARQENPFCSLSVASKRDIGYPIDKLFLDSSHI